MTAQKLGIGIKYIVYGVIVCFFLYTIYYILPTIYPVHAQAASSATTVFKPVVVAATNVNVQQAAEVAILGLENSLYCQLAGVGVFGKGCVSYDSNGKLQVLNNTPNGGAIGGVGNVVAFLYDNKPLSTREFLKDQGLSLGFINPAHAQSSEVAGYGVIEPVKGVWKVIQNLAYLAFTVVFMVVGLMIMFRRKINPQTVISLQSALPGLVIGLVLVYFSYFFSALIIDTSFVGVKLVSGVFFSGSPPVLGGDPILGTRDMLKDTDNANVLRLYTPYMFGFGSRNTIDGLNQLFRGLINDSGGPTAPDGKVNLGTFVRAGFGGFGFIPSFPVVGPITNWLQDFIAGTLAYTLGALLGLVLLVALLIQMLRLLWALLNAYIVILVSAMTAPFIILLGSFPGRGGTLSVWWKTLLGNALIFPAVYAVFLLSATILSYGNDHFTQTLPLFGGLNPSLLKSVIAFGLILGAPAVPKMVKEALKVQDLKGIPEAATGAAIAGFGTLTNSARKGVSEAFEPELQQRRARQEQIIKNRLNPNLYPNQPAPPPKPEGLDIAKRIKNAIITWREKAY